MSLKVIADRFNVKATTVCNAMARLGVRFPPEGKYRCLHDKTTDNTIKNGSLLACRECHNRRGREYFRRSHGLPLAEAWKVAA